MRRFIERLLVYQVYHKAMLADIRYALRQLCRSPGFAAAAIATLALGIGANTSIFSLADAVLLRPLPYPHADRLVVVWDQLLRIGLMELSLRPMHFDAYRADNSIFESSAAFLEDDVTLTAAGRAERVFRITAMPELFEMLGARTVVGRGFSEEDARPERNNVAVLSYRLFARQFGEDKGIIGQSIRLEDRAFTVIGVLAPEFGFSLRSMSADVWTPLPPFRVRDPSRYKMLARLRSGIPIETAQASVTAAANRIEETVRPYHGPNGEDAGYRAKVVPLHNQLLGKLQTSSLILLSAVGLVLLIACVNVANLLLARAAARERETAIRRALGASGSRLARQWMTEAAVLAAIGGAAGAIVSRWGVAALKALGRAQLPEVASIAVDERAMLFAFALACVVCVLFGLAPSLTAMRFSSIARASRRSRRTSGVLVAAEVALAVVLLIGAGLLLKSFVHLRNIDPGFRADHLLTMRVQLSGEPYSQARQKIAFWAQLRERLAVLQGVISVSAVSRLPIAPIGNLASRTGNPFSIEGRAWDPNGITPQIAHTQHVSVDYFRTMRIPLLAGRDFQGTDAAETTAVAIVNETLARRYFPDGAIGRRLVVGSPHPGAQWLTIVGVIADIKTGALDQPALPQFYMAEAQEAQCCMTVAVRTTGDPMLLAREASATVRSIDPGQPVYDIMTAEQRVDNSIGQPRYQTMILVFFATTALFLAAVGIYGVVAHATIQRTREIGIRMALGANPARVTATVLAEGMRPVAVGIAVGVLGAAAMVRFLSTTLFGVAPLDPGSFVSAVAVLAAVAGTACLLPARRAALVDPLTALREE